MNFIREHAIAAIEQGQDILVILPSHGNPQKFINSIFYELQKISRNKFDLTSPGRIRVRDMDGNGSIVSMRYSKNLIEKVRGHRFDKIIFDENVDIYTHEMRKIRQETYKS